MSNLGGFLAQLENEAKALEDKIAQSLANHNFLLGAKAAVLNIIELSAKAANVVAPSSPVTEVLNAAEAIATTLENASAPVEAVSQP